MIGEDFKKILGKDGTVDWWEGEVIYLTRKEKNKLIKEHNKKCPYQTR